jgi:hypothetical protein
MENILDCQNFFRLGTVTPPAISLTGLWFRFPQGISQPHGTPADVGHLGVRPSERYAGSSFLRDVETPLGGKPDL